MKRLKYLALATLVAFAACDEGDDLGGPSGATGSVAVTVTAEGSGVAGVTVNLVGPTQASLTTDASGAVTFQNVQAGAYAVTISGVPAGIVCSNTSTTASVTASSPNATAAFTCNVVRSSSISGQVTAGGAAVEGATVQISGPEGTEERQTGAAGAFQFTGLVAGSYAVTLQAADIGGIVCVESTQNVTLEPGESEVANFSCGGQQQQASVAIERITTVAGTAVDRTNVAGIIVVQVGVDEGGQDVDTVRVFANDVQVCEQTFDEAAAVSGPMAQDEEFEIDCVFNTAAIRNLQGQASAQFSDAGDGRAFEPIFLNGDIVVRAEAITESGDDPDARETITLVNADVLALNVTAENPDAPNSLIEPGSGLRWLSGSLTFDVYPIIFSAPFDPNNPNIARVNFGFDSYVSNEVTTHFSNDTDSRPQPGANGIPASWGLNSQTPVTAATSAVREGSFRFVLSDSILGGTMTGGVLQVGNAGGVDDLITGDIGAQNLAISTITSFGQFGPSVICANISTTCVGTGGTTTTNPLRVFYQGVLQSGTGAVNNVLRVDNQEPWANSIAIDPHPLESMFPTPTAGITTNGTSAVRGGFNFNGFRDGWVNHDYAFDGSEWNGTTTTTSGLGTVYSGATDQPNFYGTHPNFALPAGVVAGTTPLAGIGLASTTAPAAFVAAASDATNSPSAFTITGMTSQNVAGPAQRLRNAAATNVTTGEDLPGETGLGLDALPAPNTNERDDISLVAVVADHFENAGITNILELGVDGQAPVFVTTTFPTAAGTLYNTYGTTQASNPSNVGGTGLTCVGTAPNQTCTTTKTAGEFTGTTNDTGNGFSGVAGVSMSDFENGCAAGELFCSPGTFSNERTGVTLQAAAVLAPTSVLAWEWSIDGGNTFLAPLGGNQPAYDATVATPTANDGYRQQIASTWDRAANVRESAATAEHIADKTRPVVGNVEMPTVTSFDLGTSYTFRGEVEDTVDLKESDFDFDFNTITTIQPYSDESVGTAFAPGVDAYGNPYVANAAGTATATGNSLQLPLREIDHTAFGSAVIDLHENLAATVEFVGCVVLFDEGGAPDNSSGTLADDPNAVHIPRGPRWRSWDHAYPYGLINTQFNTFTPSSVPTTASNTSGCANGESAATIRSKISPSASTAGAWNFGLGVGGTAGKLQITASGQSGVFVPDDFFPMLDVYYIDAEGRARILSTDGTGWSGPVVTDTGTGAQGRTYTWTYDPALPTATTTPDGFDEPYFFTIRFGDGTALMWDDTANP